MNHSPSHDSTQLLQDMIQYATNNGIKFPCAYEDVYNIFKDKLKSFVTLDNDPCLDDLMHIYSIATSDPKQNVMFASEKTHPFGNMPIKNTTKYYPVADEAHAFLVKITCLDDSENPKYDLEIFNTINGEQYKKSIYSAFDCEKILSSAINTKLPSLIKNVSKNIPYEKNSEGLSIAFIPTVDQEDLGKVGLDSSKACTVATLMNAIVSLHKDGKFDIDEFQNSITNPPQISLGNAFGDCASSLKDESWQEEKIKGSPSPKNEYQNKPQNGI